jgi:hypothetical protein
VIDLRHVRLDPARVQVPDDDHDEDRQDDAEYSLDHCP